MEFVGTPPQPVPVMGDDMQIDNRIKQGKEAQRAKAVLLAAAKLAKHNASMPAEKQIKPKAPLTEAKKLAMAEKMALYRNWRNTTYNALETKILSRDEASADRAPLCTQPGERCEDAICPHS